MDVLIFFFITFTLIKLKAEFQNEFPLFHEHQKYKSHQVQKKPNVKEASLSK